jgi:hypothetical protein
MMICSKSRMPGWEASGKVLESDREPVFKCRRRNRYRDSKHHNADPDTDSDADARSFLLMQLF